MVVSLHCVLLLSILTTILRLSGADGFHLRLETTTECLDTCGSNQDCRYNDCRVPTGTEVNVTCTLFGACDPHTHPLSIHRIDSEGNRQITKTANGAVMPGFVRLDHLTNCSLRMTFVATSAAEGVVLQCAIYTESIKEFSMAHVVTVREPLEPATSTPSPTALPSPSPTMTSSSTPETASDSTEPPDTTSVDDPVSNGGDSQQCQCAIPTITPTSSSQRPSLHRLLLLATLSLAPLLLTAFT